MPPSRPDPLAEHWKALSLQPGAPACVIKEAHRFHIRLAHPDVGGSVEDATRVNVALDRLGSKGAAANEHVARYVSSGEPWHVLGLAPSADQRLVERAGKALTAELSALPRLQTRVEWAVRNFGSPRKPPPPAPRVRREPAAKPQQRPKGFWVPPPPRSPITGRPDGLPQTIDFGEVTPGSAAERIIRLTWPGNAPSDIRVDTRAPLASEITYSKTNRGRVALRLAVDWDAPLFDDRNKALQSFDARLALCWGEDGGATVRVMGSVAQPVRVAAGPTVIDFGSVRLRQPARAELTIRSSRTVEVNLAPSAWLFPTDSKGRRLGETFRIDGHTPLILTIGIDWAPIVERGTASIAAKRPLRPSGRITARWDGGELTVPVTMLVSTK